MLDGIRDMADRIAADAIKELTLNNQEYYEIVIEALDAQSSPQAKAAMALALINAEGFLYKIMSFSELGVEIKDRLVDAQVSVEAKAIAEKRAQDAVLRGIFEDRNLLHTLRVAVAGDKAEAILTALIGRLVGKGGSAGAIEGPDPLVVAQQTQHKFVGRSLAI